MRSFDSGFFTLFHVRRVAFRLHATLPLLVIWALLVWSLWAPLVMFGVILIHELGHAFLARRLGLAVVSIDVHAFGGFCRYRGDSTEVKRAVIAWGGVLAQGAIVGAGVVVLALLPFSGDIGRVLRALILYNALMIGLNLLPFRGLDGREAWPLFRWRNIRRVFRKRRGATKDELRAQQRKIEAELARIVQAAGRVDRHRDRN